MRVLMIAPQPFLEPRGTPISVYQRLHGLSRLGHSIDLVTYHLGEDVSLPGVRIYRIPGLGMIKELKVGPSWPKLPLDLLLFFKAFGLLLRGKYDVIHAHEEAAIFSLILAALFRTRSIYDMHSSLPRQLVNFNFGNNPLIIKLFQVFERLVINACDALITIGSDLEMHAQAIKPSVVQMMIENLPMRARLTEADLRAVAALRQEYRLEGKLAVVYTGTFECYQGVRLLIESAGLVCRAHPEIVFFLVGGKPGQVLEWQEAARQAGLEGRVIFTGTVPVETANRYLDIADILVSPRIGSTSVPLKIYTYLLSGKPILATNLSAHTLVLTSETAVLVEPTKEAFADGLVQLISNPELRQRLGAQAQKLAEEKYSQAAYLARLEKIYRTLQPAVASKDQAVHSLDN
ncbi:MAG TPA: glycosyltransferase family 4 protein [Anaerolineales bacterium]|nr:glycosyltransferase family 4 protein [Anaerolineales bacterium]